MNTVFWALPALLILPADHLEAMAQFVRSKRIAIRRCDRLFYHRTGCYAYSMNKPVLVYSPGVLKNKASFLQSLAKIDNGTIQPLIKSKFNVYFDPEKRRLIYTTPSFDLRFYTTRFFLHAFPEDQNILRKKNIDGAAQAFDASPMKMDYIVQNYFQNHNLMRGSIIFWKLPDYKVKRIRTGQFEERKNAPPEKRWHNFWEGWADLE